MMKLLMPASLARLGQTIRKERQKRRLSQEGLASLSRLSRTYVGDVERGTADVSFSSLERIADALGMTMSDLVREYEQR